MNKQHIFDVLMIALMFLVAIIAMCNIVIE